MFLKTFMIFLSRFCMEKIIFYPVARSLQFFALRHHFLS